MFHDLPEAWSWIESLKNLEKTPDLTKRAYKLDRMKFLFEAFGDPHKKIPVFHIAGSKGKGSTATLLAEMLKSLGFKTGLYTSPHLESYEERITVAGLFFLPEDYLWGINKIFEFLKNDETVFQDLGGAPTTFEVLTLLAFLIFVKKKMDVVVLETGLGGRLDATNLVDPIASIITRIELEHKEILGPDLVSIAREKAGIIKKGRPLFCADQVQEVKDVFIQECQVKGSPFYFLPDSVLVESIKTDQTGTFFKGQWSNGDRISMKIGAIGKIQVYNTLIGILALRTLGYLTEKNFHCIYDHLEKRQIPGRFQILPGPVVLDGAHTPVSVAAAGATFNELFGSDSILIFGSFDGKELESMGKILRPLFKKVFITPPGFFRSSDPPKMANSFGINDPNVLIFANPDQAYIAARKEGKPIFVCGSFYLVGEILKSIKRLN